ncbi:2-haloacid dehalogenase [Oscillibacter sp. PC13]|uniref:YjjG family noncanonical pyrimidine nucleotidase n=1 Tax=Oscillibacter sp. PC13 TaxID=1855299 RepID=UPI0008E058DB|nr:YjjG family noncanonical pyrimidine nucleotidase [Oscillibacter sp. PC13]SFP74247.1 2-haloacid dehalogenase [Oscillibacter sp. PC13]
MIETVFLDLDNTILDFTHAEAVALRRALMETGLPAEDSVLARYHAINQRQWELLEAGILTREQVLTTRFELLFQELGVQADPRSVCDRYEGYLAEGHFLIPGALELLRELAPRYDLYLASNGAAAVQYSRLKKAGIGAYFKGVFISEEVGCDKPGKAFFDRCFAAILNFHRMTALMVGDSLTSDIQGGINAEIRTCLYCPEGETSRRDIIPDFVIRRLGELPPLLETL